MGNPLPIVFHINTALLGIARYGIWRYMIFNSLLHLMTRRIGNVAWNLGSCTD